MATSTVLIMMSLLSIFLISHVVVSIDTTMADTVKDGNYPKNYPCIGAGNLCPGYPFPYLAPGFSYMGSPMSKVHLEVFGDNLCYFTRAAWPTLQLLKAHYLAQKADLEIRFHWIPLPFHHNAYFVAMADHYIGTTMTSDKLFEFADFVFANQNSFLQQATDLTESEVKDRIADAAVNSTGIDYTVIREALDNKTVDDFTRVAWKYAVKRTVFETPTFYLNGFEIDQPPSTLNYTGPNITGWTNILDPVLSFTPSQSL